MFQPAKGYTANTPEIKSDGKVLNNVDSFTYLGSNLSFSNNLDGEVYTRNTKASASYGRLHKRVWNERGLKLETKCAVYRAVILTALFYGWTPYRKTCQASSSVSPTLPPMYFKHHTTSQSTPNFCVAHQRILNVRLIS